MQLNELISQFSETEKLGTAFEGTARQYYLPLLAQLVEYKRPDCPLFIGINGSQGSGKSTLAKFLAFAASNSLGWRVTCLSLDDIYLTKAARQKLSEYTHPLFETRGVPGTHDLDLGERTLEGLRNLSEGETLPVPRFDKSADDQYPQSQWSVAEGRQDLVIFEGWCVGCEPQSPDKLEPPLNELESRLDPDGSWRRHVNNAIKEYESRLWQKLDLLVMLKAPSFDQVYHWRLEQEKKLVEALGFATELSDPSAMKFFISHYERLTRHMLSNLETRADIVFRLREDRMVSSVDPELPVIEGSAL